MTWKVIKFFIYIENMKIQIKALVFTDLRLRDIYHFNRNKKYSVALTGFKITFKIK